MGQEAQEFWDALHERWRADTADREARLARSVLVHLRRRLPGAEYRHLEAELPADLRTAWAEPGRERPYRKGSIEKSDRNTFLAAVQAETGLPDLADAEIATAAVFYALARFLGPDERRHVANQLPKGLRERWIEEATPPRGPTAA